MQTAALVVVGDEILSGKIADRNGPLAIRRLRELGVRLGRIAVVPDDLDLVADEVRRSAAAHRWVVTSGGIGPTHDDCTIAAVAAAFDLPVVRNPELEAELRRLWRGPIAPAAWRNADVPEGARLLAGADPFLPAVVCRNVYILPGVPEIFAAKWRSVEAELTGTPVFERAVRLRCGESSIADLLRDVQRHHPRVRIGSYPRLGEGYRVRVTIEGEDPSAVDAAAAALREVVTPADIDGEE